MRLIGIKINKGTEDIRILKDGWYGFYNVEEPTYKDIKNPQEYLSTINDYGVYSLGYDNSPEIHVQCIAGKNGSGKSSLLDIFYRMINDFTTEANEKDNTKNANIIRSYLNTDSVLYYEMNNEICRIQIKGSSIQWFVSENEKNISLKDLNQFFYTIAINYSLYSFNFGDENWEYYLFGNSDDYLTPIALYPERVEGNIDVQGENKKAIERIMALSLFLGKKKNDFLGKYKLLKIHFYLNYDYEETLKILNKKLRNRFIGFSKDFSSDFYHGIDQKTFEKYEYSLNHYWNDYLNDCLGNHCSSNSSDQENYLKEIASKYLTFNTIYMYLVYKKFNKYSSQLYKDMHDGNGPDNNIIKYFIESALNDKSQISLKIRQCITFFKSNNHTKNSIGLEEQKGKTFNNVDEAYLSLPPEFYNTTMIFSNNNTKVEICSKPSYESKSFMSSGEIQRLYSFSYIMYHIENMIKKDDSEIYGKYKNLNIIIDEAELYYHPAFQQDFLDTLLSYIRTLQINKEQLESINIVVVTHSPFILSDMFRKNTLYLEDGNPTQRNIKETFGANYYDLLKNGFFFESSVIGKIAEKAIKNKLKSIGNNDVTSELEESAIGDPIIRGFVRKKKEIIEYEMHK